MQLTERSTSNLLAAAALSVTDAVRGATERELGLGGGAAAALVTLAAFPGRPLAELTAALGISQPGTARLLDRLVAAGWAERRQTAGRELSVVLTVAGSERVDRVLWARETAVLELLAALKPEDLDALRGPLIGLLESRAAKGRDPRHLCRLCDRSVCARSQDVRCPVAAGASREEL